MRYLLLILSLAANVALGVVFFRGSAPKLSDDTNGKTPRAASSESTATPALNTSLQAAENAAVVAAIRALDWSTLQTGDLPALVGRLRAAGLPPAMVRAVVSGVLGMEFIARRQELTAAEANVPYWQDALARRDPKVAEELQKLSREHARILRELLGSEPISEADESYYRYRRSYGDLAPDKLARVRDIDRDYGELGMQRRAGGLTLPGDRELQSLLEKEKSADLAAVLTPAELEEYQLRSSTAASILRWQYAAVEPTEAEFRALYRATRLVDEKLGPLGNVLTSEMLEQRAEVMREVMPAELNSVLSPERLEEFQQLSDPQYAQTAKVVTRLRLPAATTREVVAIQRTATERASAIRGDQSLDAEGRRAALEQLSRETTAQLTDQLGGSRGFEAYRINGGFWLNTLHDTGTGGPRG